MVVVVQRHIYNSVVVIEIESGTWAVFTLIHPNLQGIGQWRIRVNFRQQDGNVFGVRRSYDRKMKGAGVWL